MNAIVTGARRGIGRAITKKLVDNGINVWVTTSHMDDVFIEDMNSLMGEAWVHPIEMDLRNQDSIKRLLRQWLRM